jgi:hypothetical protein
LWVHTEFLGSHLLSGDGKEIGSGNIKLQGLLLSMVEAFVLKIFAEMTSIVLGSAGIPSLAC